MKSTKKPLRKNKQTENVEVFCRIRPIELEDKCVKKISNNTLALTFIDNKSGLTTKETRYSFQKVFDEASRQEEVFGKVAFPLVDDLLHGKNGLLFAYGVTSSGKTHTMQGTSRDKGVLDRCLDCLFNSIRPVQAKKYVFKGDRMNGFDVQTEADAMLERQNREITPRLLGTKSARLSSSTPNMNSMGVASKLTDIDYDSSYAVFVNYVEVYNNYVYDLLEELPLELGAAYKSPTSKTIREDMEHRMYVSGVVEVEVTSADEALEVFMKGQKRRKVAATTLNRESSRSHSIFSVRLVQGPLDPQGEHVLLDKRKLLVSQMSLVDLAGSERTGRTGSAGDRLKEAGNINQSLMVLRTCIEVLRENQKNSPSRLVPYRDSKVTLLFKSFFEGEGRVTMVVCVNPMVAEYDETLNVMKFAELTQEVQIAKAQVNRPDVGLMPGRRQANLQNKEAMKAMDDLKELNIMNLGPNFPPLLLNGPLNERTNGDLWQFLKDRHTNRSNFLADVTNKEEAFRARLVAMTNETNETKEELIKVNKSLKENEKKLEDANKLNESLVMKMSVYEHERSELEKEVGDRTWTIVQEKLKINQLRQDFNAKLDHNAKQYSQNIEQARMKASLKMKGKQHKLDLLKAIMDQTSSSTPRSETPISTRTGREFGVGGFRVPTQPPSSCKKRTRSPPPVKPKPLTSHRRRSKSTDKLWIEHRPDPIDHTSTILHPKLKSLRTVAKITEKELKEKDTNKYLLASQGYDSQGEFATKFVKGDIKTSMGGGTQVVFTDVEVVKNKSPGNNKRRSPTPPPSDGQWTDVETRCHVALDGHAKKFKSSQL